MHANVTRPFFLELFSEEIPARMQARAADDLARLVAEALAPLTPTALRAFHAPRRIALAAELAPGIAESRAVERGPRRAAPEQALAGFLRKHAATRDQLREDGDFWVLDRATPGMSAASLIAREMPGLLRRFPWPKSMRWGGTSAFTWVRPLRRIVCLLDGEVVPFDLREGADDGHGLAASNLSEGHRFLSPGPFTVTGTDAWVAELRARHVIVDPAERRAAVEHGVRTLALADGLSVIDDPGLTDEVAGLVEWPVALVGRIDAGFMDLPPEVMRVSMRVNQRYFALREPTGAAAQRFAFVANIAADDGGRAIVAGNERVLRARFSDARHFWDLDRGQTLASRVPALDGVTFHARLGSQGERVSRIVALAERIAPLVGADAEHAARAALLAKADLTTGMVGEFPELQGVMGRYYALHDGEPSAVADAVGEHYAPKGPSDAVPGHPVSIAVALADKIDQLTAFFGIGEKPSGSGDPYALRRAALGIIRIVTERRLRLNLADLVPGDVLDFLAERLRTQLRAKGARHDVLAAVLGSGLDSDFVRLLARTEAVAGLLGEEDGANLLAAYRRAANILRIEEKKDGPHDRPPDPAIYELAQERDVAEVLDTIVPGIQNQLRDEEFTVAMATMATLRVPLDAFFDKVTVNDPRPDIRRNRLRLLSRVSAAISLAADFSKIEG